MPFDPIVVVGCSVRLPRVYSLTSMWQTMFDLVDVSSATPDERYDAQRLHHPRSTPGAVIATHGYYIDDVDMFDAEFFGIEPTDADWLDPQQRILLELVWMAMEDAGIPPSALRGTATNVYVGSAHTDYWDNIIRLGLSKVPGEAVMNARSLLAGRISYHYDLRGAAITLDTACSSSLVGVQLAMQSLLSGDSDTCIIGGVNLKLNEYQDVVLSQIPVLSTEGKCKFGDAYADGFVAADGAGVLILRRRSHALRDGNRIRATIRSAIVTNDGARGGSATAPSTDAHVELLERALNSAKVKPNDVDFIEAHGPGAPLIDRMELEALNTVFGQHPDRTRPLFVSSGKSVFGHSEAAAGVTSLVRTILSLESRVALPSNHIRHLHRSIDWSQTHLQIPLEPTALKSTGPLIAGVSAQGISSVNAHVILENWEPTSRPSGSLSSPPCLVASAPTRSALRASVIGYHQKITESVSTATQLSDILWTALLGREIFNCRVAFLADTQTQLLSLIQAWLAESESQSTHEPIVAGCTDETLGGRVNAARAFIENGDPEPLSKITTPGRIVPAPGYQWRRSKHWIPGSRLQATSGT